MNRRLRRGSIIRECYTYRGEARLGEPVGVLRFLNEQPCCYATWNIAIRSWVRVKY